MQAVFETRASMLHQLQCCTALPPSATRTRGVACAGQAQQVEVWVLQGRDLWWTDRVNQYIQRQRAQHKQQWRRQRGQRAAAVAGKRWRRRRRRTPQPSCTARAAPCPTRSMGGADSSSLSLITKRELLHRVATICSFCQVGSCDRQVRGEAKCASLGVGLGGPSSITQSLES